VCDAGCGPGRFVLAAAASSQVKKTAFGVDLPKKCVTIAEYFMVPWTTANIGFENLEEIKSHFSHAL
jgi:hypothetical protein